jgi:hypothetical protein
MADLRCLICTPNYCLLLACFSKYKSSTALASGAAFSLPLPAFSTMTAIAIFGFSIGANPEANL